MPTIRSLLKLVTKKDIFALSIFVFLTLIILNGIQEPGYIFSLDLQMTPSSKVVDNDILYSLGAFQFLISGIVKVIPAQIAERLILFLVLYAIPLTGYMFSKKFFPFVYSVIFSIFLLWNPFVYSRFIVGHIGILISISLINTLLCILNSKSKNIIYLIILVFTIGSLISSHFVWFSFTILLISCLVDMTQSSHKLMLLRNYIIIFSAMTCIALIILLITTLSFGEEIDNYYFLFNSGNLLKLLTLEGFWLDFEQIELHSKLLGPILHLILWLVIYTCFSFGIFDFLKSMRINFKTSKEKKIILIILSSSVLGLILSSLTQSWAGTIYEHIFIIPGFAVMREAQKWLVLYMIGLAFFTVYGLFKGLDVLKTRITKLNIPISTPKIQTFINSRILKSIPITLFSIIIFITTFNFPSLAGRQVKVAMYPESWYRLNKVLDKSDTVISLPWEAYSFYRFSDKRIANPSNRFFTSKVMSNPYPDDYSLYQDCDIQSERFCLNYNANYQDWDKFLISNSIDYIVINQTDNFDEEQLKNHLLSFPNTEMTSMDQFTYIIHIKKRETKTCI